MSDKVIPDTFYKGHEEFEVKYRFEDGTGRLIAVRKDFPQGAPSLMQEEKDSVFITEEPISYVGVKPNGVATSYTSLEGMEGSALDPNEKNSLVLKLLRKDDGSFTVEELKNEAITLKEFYYGDIQDQLQQKAQGEA